MRYNLCIVPRRSIKNSKICVQQGRMRDSYVVTIPHCSTVDLGPRALPWRLNVASTNAYTEFMETAQGMIAFSSPPHGRPESCSTGLPSRSRSLNRPRVMGASTTTGHDRTHSRTFSAATGPVQDLPSPSSECAAWPCLRGCAAA